MVGKPLGFAGRLFFFAALEESDTALYLDIQGIARNAQISGSASHEIDGFRVFDTEMNPALHLVDPV